MIRKLKPVYFTISYGDKQQSRQSSEELFWIS